MRKNETIPVEELPADAPKFGRWVKVFDHGAPLFVPKEAVCRVIAKFGNNTDGWRYIVEYKATEGPITFSPATFHIEPAPQEEWINQEPFVYPYQAWERAKKEYNELPPSYISLSSGDWYEVYSEDPKCKEAFPERTDLVGLQNFCEKAGLEFVSERHIINHLNSLNWKVKKVGSKYY